MHTAERKRSGRIVANSALILFLGIAFLCFFSAIWFVKVYGRLGFDAVLSTLTGGLGGVQNGLVVSYLSGSILPAVLCTAGLGFFLFFSWKKLPLGWWLRITLCLALSLSAIIYAAFHVEMVDYIIARFQNSVLYETQYRDPSIVPITFPEKKRNLIYILMESMELTFADQENGGAMEENRIPELTALAQNNVNFSQNSGVGGFRQTIGNTWTIGAMVSQTAGIPLKVPDSVGDLNSYGQQGMFLPGVTTLQSILHENGYNQALMVGSDAGFGGRDTYYATHGTDRIYDLYTARADGIIPQDYYVWWGMEDLYLYDYAKTVLTDMAAEDSPFAFSMLTVDTHHVGGYPCSLCGNAYAEQYENVYACASKQLDMFIDWLQQQSFYENTTVVIVGDHVSMDNAYIQRTVTGDYVRRIYNCFLNPAVQPVQEKHREFTTVDLFPTTLAAMGCTIEGNRLGLGVNLFSAEPTLTEAMSYEGFYAELEKDSAFYRNHFFESR